MTSTKLDRTRGGRGRAADEWRAKSDVTSTPTAKDRLSGGKGRAHLVRVVIYLEAIEPDSAPATPAPAP